MFARAIRATAKKSKTNIRSTNQTHTMKCKKCGATNASNEPECWTGCGYIFSKVEILVTKHGLVVDGKEVHTRNRWEAKAIASRLALERGVPWYSQKDNGDLVPVNVGTIIAN